MFPATGPAASAGVGGAAVPGAFQFSMARTTFCGTFALLRRIKLSASIVKVAAEELIFAITMSSSTPPDTIFIMESLVRTSGSELRGAGALGAARGAAGFGLGGGFGGRGPRGERTAASPTTQK